MKTINVRELQQKIRETIEAAQKERVVVTRYGRPVVVVIGIAGYDWEDLYWATNASFWKMIEERRRERTVPLSEVRRRLRAPRRVRRRR